MDGHYLTDRTAWYELTGSVGADLLMVGTASLMGAIAGIALTGGTAYVACSPIGFAILISVGVGFSLEYLNEKYKLTEKLIALLKDMDVEADKAVTVTGEGFWNILRSSGFGMGNWVYRRY